MCIEITNFPIEITNFPIEITNFPPCHGFSPAFHWFTPLFSHGLIGWSGFWSNVPRSSQHCISWHFAFLASFFHQISRSHVDLANCFFVFFTSCQELQITSQTGSFLEVASSSKGAVLRIFGDGKAFRSQSLRSDHSALYLAKQVGAGWWKLQMKTNGWCLYDYEYIRVSIWRIWCVGWYVFYCVLLWIIVGFT